MSPRVSIKIRDAISRLTAEAARESESSAIKEAARATGALPVHTDMSGALALTSNGDVIQYDFETGTTSAPEENWRIAALTKAARRFPELRDLAPPRPNSAVDCPSCSGRGVILGNMDCGTCFGTGWTAQSK
jgi:hypothetical protein